MTSMRIILPFSPKMPYKRNLGVLRRTATLLFSLPWVQIVSFLLFFFAFLSPVSFSSDAVLHARGVFFFLSLQKKRKKADVLLSLCPSFLRKEKKKTPVQGREKASRAIFLRRSSFSFSFFVSFSLSPPVLFLTAFRKKGILPLFFVGFFILKKRGRKGRRKAFRAFFCIQGRQKKGMPQTREDSAKKKKKGEEEETDVLCIRFPCPPEGRISPVTAIFAKG